MSEKPKISVIIPIFNTEKWLNKCIQSIINQTYKNLEIICVDDGSTDNSRSIVIEFQKRDNRIILISQQNQGVSAARSNGISKATGEYIAFVDSDDYLEEDMYSVLYSMAIEYNADISHCGYMKHKSNNVNISINGTEKVFFQNNIEALNCLLSCRVFTGSLCSKLYKRSLFDDVECSNNIRVNEDVLLNYFLFKNSKLAVFKDICLYHVNEDPNSSSRMIKNYPKQVDIVKVAKIIYEDCINFNCPPDLKDIAATKYFYCLQGLYRVCLFEMYHNSGQLRKEIQQTINSIKCHLTKASNKQKFNYMMMKSFPRLYICLYKIYDHIRTPNWDVEL